MEVVTLITDDYVEQNRLLHEQVETYGMSGWQWTERVLELCENFGTKDVLDYGCGKGELARTLPFFIQAYDPAIPGRDMLPAPADIVVCADVMEHIEPECLDAVLEHIAQLTKVVAYFVIATRPAGKTLPDGRNTHLIVQDGYWWGAKLGGAGFKLLRIDTGRKGEAIFTVTPPP